jgi:hypothetical protein
MDSFAGSKYLRHNLHTAGKTHVLSKSHHKALIVGPLQTFILYGSQQSMVTMKLTCVRFLSQYHVILKCFLSMLYLEYYSFFPLLFLSEISSLELSIILGRF